MSPPEGLFRLEIEFHHRLRTQAPGTADVRALHISYALQAGYEALIGAVGTVTAREFERLHARLALTGDARDILAPETCDRLPRGISGLQITSTSRQSIRLT
jgi:hypothetical protein